MQRGDKLIIVREVSSGTREEIGRGFGGEDLLADEGVPTTMSPGVMRNVDFVMRLCIARA